MSFRALGQGQGLIDVDPDLAAFNGTSNKRVAPCCNSSLVEICVASVGRVTYSEPLPARIAGLKGSTGPEALP